MRDAPRHHTAFSFEWRRTARTINWALGRPGLKPRNVFIGKEPPTTTDRKAVQKFQTIVQRNTQGDDRDIAQAAREIADRLAELAEHHDPLHLALL